MHNKDKINYWKLTTFILGLVVILSMAYITYEQDYNYETINGMNIPNYDLKSINKTIPNGYQYILCSLDETNKCALIKKP
jgi:hypothetical protein